MDKDPHGGDGGFRVDEEAAEEDHDLVPPPLKADGNAAWYGQLKQPSITSNTYTLPRKWGPPFFAGFREEDVDRQEEYHVVVRQNSGERHPFNAELELNHQQPV